ncbi:hypothetical protein [Zunongwangia sp. HRR-M8]|uniref:hypothetical protein n=1 Tax=Zunongwangia sp. HRR-M8 TaxID=3015170 RepID=UPI0022DD6DC0|nr:hypothetical protein [Zunongwangia sp. HRR-M8]WBL23730.1 hypothetical protein PBT89_07160 [Zunongwangia sp. HRR-M8]
MKKLLLIGIFLLSFSCKSQFKTNELEHNFTSSQIQDLKKIKDFFESEICNNKNSDFEKCFLTILPELIEYGWQPILDNIDFDKQRELYNSISNSTFDQIWQLEKATNLRTGLKYFSLGSKYNGKYQKYVEEVGAKNPKIKEYSERLIASGDFESMDLLQRWIYHNPENFDLSDPNIQLIISIHYLTQNDQQKRKDKWKSE